MAYYYAGQNGDSFTDAEIHADNDCEDLDDPVRPLADATVDAFDATFCPNCAGGESDGEESDDADAESVEEMIDAGRCPWCPEDDRYEGEHIGSHASSAHPDAWDEYTADE